MINKEQGQSWQEEIRKNHEHKPLSLFVLTKEEAIIMEKAIQQAIDRKLVDKGSFAQYIEDYARGDSKLDYLPEEFGDVLDVIENGAPKHGRDSYLKPGVFQFGKRSQSEFRHLMKKTGLWTREPEDDGRLMDAIQLILAHLELSRYQESLNLDEESGLSHDLHSACNALMFYTVKKRGILKDGDK